MRVISEIAGLLPCEGACQSLWPWGFQKTQRVGLREA